MAELARSNPGQSNPRKTWLMNYLPVQASGDRRIASALLQAAQDAEAATLEIAGRSGVGASVRRSQLIGARGAITKILVEMYEKVLGIIRDEQANAARAAIDSAIDWDKEFLKLIEPNANKRLALEAGLRQAADRNVQAMITRVLKTKRPLSKQVYRTRSISKVQLGRVINSSLARGDSAAEMAKKVRAYIDPKVPGGVTYAARRLSRTEINNAFHAQAIDHNARMPWVQTMSWRLSKRHTPKPGDLCEQYARRTFPVASVPPKPHPQCLCYVTPDVPRIEVFKQSLEAGLYNSWIAQNTGSR